MALVALAAAGLQGCSWPDALNPIEWYRDASGASKNDDADAGARNTQNLEAGGKAPYPNLGSVPAVPDRAMSTVDREKLQKGLVADRTNARYSDDELRQGRSVPALPGEPPPQAAAPDAASATTPAPAATRATAGPAGRHSAPPAKGSEPPPQESSLTTPSPRMVPQGDAPHRAPPMPQGVAPQQQAAAPTPMPPLPTPNAAPVAPAAQPSIMSSPRGKAAVTLQAAEISFGGDGRTLSAEDNQRLTEVAKLYKQGGGSLRVIGYGRRGHGAEAAQQELASFGDALDRANAVAQALAKLGVPASRITVQAAPERVAGGLEAGRAEVLVDY